MRPVIVERRQSGNSALEIAQTPKHPGLGQDLVIIVAEAAARTVLSKCRDGLPADQVTDTAESFDSS